MSSAVRYQVMPPLSSEEYQELHESIKAEGVLEPIHVDEEGVVIDGHHRSKIANELGIPCPVIAHDDLSESQKRSLAFTLNLKRRHLNREQRRALGLESLRLDPIASNREHSKRTGLSDKTIQDIREKENIPEPRKLIEEAVEENPEKSSREIARELGVSNRTVSTVRGVQNSEFPNSTQAEEGEGIPATTFIGSDDLAELNAQVPNPEPEAKAEPRKPRRTPITDDASRIGWEIRKIAEKLEALTEDDRYDTNKEKVTPLLRGHLQFVIETATNILDDLTTPEE